MLAVSKARKEAAQHKAEGGGKKGASSTKKAKYRSTEGMSKSELRKPRSLDIEMRPGESYIAFARRVNRQKERRLQEQAHVTRLVPMSQKKKQRMDAFREKQKKRKREKRIRGQGLEDAQAATVDPDGANSSQVGKRERLTAHKQGAPQFGDVAERPPEFVSRPGKRARVAVSQLAVESHPSSDDDSESEAKRRARAIELMRAKARLAYANAKRRKREAGKANS